MWDLWWTKQHWGRFSPGTAVSLVTHSTDCYGLLSPGAGTIGQIVTDVPSGLSLNPPQKIEKLEKN
jgi:hypothetical protein